MGKGFLSVEVSGRLVKVCVCSGTLKKRWLKESFVFEVTEDVVSDGQILNAMVFSDVLTRELEERNCTIRDVVFVVGSTKVITREVLMPLLSERQVSAVVEANKETYFPLDLSGYVVKHREMGREKHGNEKGVHVLVVAMPEDLVAMCHSVEGFRVLGVDSVCFSLMSGLSLMDVKETTCFVHVEEGYTIVSVMKGKKVLFHRWFAFGGEEFVQEYRSFADSSMSYVEALEELRGDEVGIRKDDGFDFDYYSQGLADGIYRCLKNYHDCCKEELGMIVLSGSCGGLFGLDLCVEKETGIATCLLTHMVGVGKLQGFSGNREMVSTFVSGLYGCDSGVDFSEKKKEKKERHRGYTRFRSGIDFRPVLLVGMLMAMYAVYCGYTYEDGEWKK